jgi:hypothetical protein
MCAGDVIRIEVVGKVNEGVGSLIVRGRVRPIKFWNVGTVGGADERCILSPLEDYTFSATS